MSRYMQDTGKEDTRKEIQERQEGEPPEKRKSSLRYMEIMI